MDFKRDNILRHRLTKKEVVVIDSPRYGSVAYRLMSRKFPHNMINLPAMQVEREFVYIAESSQAELDNFRAQGLI